MKKLIPAIVVGLGLTCLIYVHLAHEVLVEDYHQGCYDVIQEAAKNQNVQIPDQAILGGMTNLQSFLLGLSVPAFYLGCHCWLRRF